MGKTQLGLGIVMRELEKAVAAFTPVNEESAKRWPIIATGNWGCGVFGGIILLKAILQWIAASEAGCAIRYFPFDATIGKDLERLSKSFVENSVTVARIMQALLKISEEVTVTSPENFLEELFNHLDGPMKQRACCTAANSFVLQYISWLFSDISRYMIRVALPEVSHGAIDAEPSHSIAAEDWLGHARTSRG